MATVNQPVRTIAEAASRQARQYADGHDRPLGGYALTMAVYAGIVGVLGGAAQLTRRPAPGRLTFTDVLLSAAATHKLSRLLAKDPVTSPLRAPFTSFQGTAGPAELAEDVRGDGGRHTIGELVTCPFCTGMWVATGITAGRVYLPRTTRLAVETLAALAGADLFQFAHTLLDKAAA